jgi:tetratricopeptide (TPR) repeat protein
METDDANKSGLTEEYYLRAASLLAICYARSGNMPVAWQVYDAMFQASREMYSRYSAIRERTQKQLYEIESALRAGSLTPPAVTSSASPGAGSTNVVTNSPGSVVQPGGSNSLAHRPMTPEEQDRVIGQLQTRADNAGGNEKAVEEVLAELYQLLNNPSIGDDDFNVVRVAVLRGQLLDKQGRISDAAAMYDLAYKTIMDNRMDDKRDTEPFVQAAFGCGHEAERNGDYAKAAQYYGEAYHTTTAKVVKNRAELLYRFGTTLLKIPARRTEGLGCFEEIDDNEKTSDYWSHAALQLAIENYINGDYGRCEMTVDELIGVMPDKAILDRVLYLKGELAMRNKQWDIAADAFDAVRTVAPTGSLAKSAARKRSEASNQMAGTTPSTQR